MSCHHQDRFCLLMLPNTNITFLDIGCHHPIGANNTFLLENYANGRGIGFDIHDWSKEWAGARQNKFIHADATTFKWSEELPNYPIFSNKVIDYISFDVDDATLSAFNNFPWKEYEFKVMTIEHDRYRVGDETCNATRKVLRDLGYELICEDVIAEGYGEFEDWWVNPKYVDMNIAEKLRCKSVDSRFIM